MSPEISQSATAFRPFFLGAALVSIISISLWGLVYFLILPLPLSTISSYQWHAHEMIYGYAVAVIAGFLLTAVVGWTGKPGARREALALLLILWLLARLLFTLGYIHSAGLFDVLFVVCLSVLVTRPIIQSRQWRQMAVVSKLILLGLANVSFYLGSMGVLAMGVHWGVYGGLYLVLGLILTMGRRVLPGLIEDAESDTGGGKPLFNSIWLDMGSLLLFLAFFVLELMGRWPMLSACFALATGLLNGLRLVFWYRPVIWTKSLLWSLYLSLWMIVVGLLLFAFSYFFGWSRFPAIHAMAFGGIGLVTLSMMSRVILEFCAARTPPILTWAFVCLFLGTVFRVALPLLWSAHYLTWIAVSQLFWVASFLLFLLAFAPIFLRGRWGADQP